MIANIHGEEFGGKAMNDEGVHNIKHFYIMGQSQGGAIATLLYVLWHSNVECPFHFILIIE